jgi:haloalkane dehalogenase
MKVLRTPDSAFADIEDFPFSPHYHQISPDLRLHYIDEGRRDAPVVLMMHGEPSWSYLYRHMIGPVVEAGFRVVAPDLIGFGKSDKPASKDDYSYAKHVAWIRQWIEALDLKEVTLACQDWGSLIGLRLVSQMPERFAGVALSNGGLPTGQAPPRAFAIWRAFSRFSPIFPIGKIISAGTKRGLSAQEIAAYDAPFPSSASKAGARIFPTFVPLGPNVAIPDQLKAWEVLETFEKPFLCCFSNGDPITRGGDEMFRTRVPGAKNQPHTTLRGGHFIQEDDPQGFVECILKVAKS